MGAELINCVMKGRLDMTGHRLELRPETWLEGIDSQATLTSWSDGAYHSGATEWQMEAQAGR